MTFSSELSRFSAIKFLFWSHIISFSFLIFHICLYIFVVCMHLFIHLYAFVYTSGCLYALVYDLLNSLSIFKTVDFKYLPSNSNLFFFGQFSLLYSVNGLYIFHFLSIPVFLNLTFEYYKTVTVEISSFTVIFAGCCSLLLFLCCVTFMKYFFFKSVFFVMCDL